MKYYSLLGNAPIVDFKTATINGQAPDKGLYFPAEIPHWEKDFFLNVNGRTPIDLSFEMIRPYVGDCIPEADLFEIVKQTLNFPVPLVQVKEGIYALEMFHGNTLAFKDIGARFMSRCLGHFVRDQNRKVTVLVATSGDTGGAVADGFYGVEGVDVVILFPSGKVSNVQKKQLTTFGKNIRALEVKGSFDDCQRMVKQAFVDDELRSRLFLTSANSINVARWLPQQFFYLMAFLQWNDKSLPPVISIPSGNFGNICAGLLAQRSGLPVSKFIAACNVNDVVTRFMKTGDFQPQKAIPTISNAMDVGDPSNFVRILQIFNNDIALLSDLFSSVSFSDDETKNAIVDLYKETGYLMDPHGAVGYMGLKDYMETHPGTKGIFAETAHPVKFYDVVEPLIAEKITLPSAVASIMDKTEYAELIDPEYGILKEYLLSAL
jgi:threonine synthase